MNIILTGASSGIGFETVLELTANNEHSVIALARSEDNLNKLISIARSLNPSCKLQVIAFDTVSGDYDGVLSPLIQSSFKSVDILINNAGILINKPFEQTSVADFNEMFQSNVIGHINMIKAITPLLNGPAHIVNIGSMGGFQGSTKFSGLSAYSVSKAALHCLTECLAAELSGSQVRVNGLALGSAQTEMLETAFPDYQSPVMAFEMGKFVADFALTGSKFFNGKILPVAISVP